jgi:hypothetical protein
VAHRAVEATSAGRSPEPVPCTHRRNLACSRSPIDSARSAATCRRWPTPLQLRWHHVREPLQRPTGGVDDLADTSCGAPQNSPAWIHRSSRRVLRDHQLSRRPSPARRGESAARASMTSVLAALVRRAQQRPKATTVECVVTRRVNRPDDDSEGSQRQPDTAATPACHGAGRARRGQHQAPSARALESTDQSDRPCEGSRRRAAAGP